MSSVNKSTLLGILTHDAEARAMPNNGGYVTNLRLVTCDEYKDKTTGELKEIKEFHRVAAYGQLAEMAREFKKGIEVYAEGRIRTRKYEVKGESRYITEINAQVLFAIGQRSESSFAGRGETTSENRSAAPAAPDASPPENDAPF